MRWFAVVLPASRVVGRSGAQLTSHWARLVFTGRAKAPEDLADDAAVKA